MRNSKNVFCTLSLGLLLFSFNGAFAQGNESEMKKLFSSTEKIEHKSYMLKYSNKETNYYWVENDTLFSCGGFMSGGKIALADIDFTKKDIVKTNMLVEGSLDYVYRLSFTPIKGKPTFSYVCLGKTFISTSNLPEYRKSITLDMANLRLANEASEYLQKLSKAGRNKSLPQSKEAPGIGYFDTQLLALINGLKDNFSTLRKDKVEERVYNSSVQLEGSVSTKIYTGLIGNVYLLASFGEFKTIQEAEAIYKKVIEKISKSKKMPATMIKQDEVSNSMSRTTAWLHFGQLDSALNGFTLELDIMTIGKLDKEYNKIDYYFVKLKIAK